MKQINWLRVWLTVGIVIGLLIIGFLVWYYLALKQTAIPLPVPKLPEGLTAEDLKRIPVPEPGEKAKEYIAIPKEAVKAGLKTENKLRIFEVKGENGLIYPASFRVYQNDIINIKLTAIDQKYDLNFKGYNIEAKVNKGETKTIEFQASNPGIFAIYCSLCKLEQVGNLIVVPK